MSVLAQCARGRWLVAAIVATMLFPFAEARVAAQPSGGALSQARTAYGNRSYQKVVTLLRPMLYPRSRFATEAEEVEAYKLLGISHYWLSMLAATTKDKQRHQKQAERQFSALLTLRPKFRLRKLQHPEHLLKFFARVRKKLKAAASPIKALETELKHCQSKHEELSTRFKAYRTRCRSRVEVTRVVSKRYYFWNFVPFGAGQFQNGQPLKGALFAATQGAMLVLNITALILGETSYVRNGPNRTVLNDEKSRTRASDIQKLTIASGSIFWALVVWGVVDAMVFYKKSTVSKQKRLIPLGSPNIGLSPQIGPDRLVLGLEARF